jgi:hypothetical protein
VIEITLQTEKTRKNGGSDFSLRFCIFSEGRQRDNPAEKTRKNEGSDLTLGFASFQQEGLPINPIPRDRKTTTRVSCNFRRSQSSDSMRDKKFPLFERLG